MSVEEDKKFAELVLKEMNERKSNGDFVPDEAIEVAQDLAQISDYSHMEVSACVDLVISLSQL